MRVHSRPLMILSQLLTVAARCKALPARNRARASGCPQRVTTLRLEFRSLPLSVTCACGVPIGTPHTAAFPGLSGNLGAGGKRKMVPSDPIGSLTLSRLARLEPCSCWHRPVSSALPLRRLSTPQRSLCRSPVAGFPATKTLALDRPFARPPRSVFYAARHEVNVPGLALLRTVEPPPPPALP